MSLNMEGKRDRSLTSVNRTHSVMKVGGALRAATSLAQPEKTQWAPDRSLPLTFVVFSTILTILYKEQ
jgi:hypothetical protein